MKKYDVKGKNRKCFTWVVTIILTVIFILILAENGIAAGKEDIKKFQVEIYGGYAPSNPKDLNLIVDYDNSIQAFYYDSQFTYLQNTNQAGSWDSTSEGERKTLKHVLPLGLRLKYFLNRSWAVSLCIKRFSQEETHTPAFSYTQIRSYGERYLEELVYSQYSLSAEGLSPLVGLHLVKSLSGSLSLEGFFSGGPLFAKCRYVSDWDYTWTIQEGNITNLASIRADRLEQQGEGTGIVLEFGLRLNYQLNRWLGTFFSAGYSYQRVTRISGYGREEIDTNSQDWQGEWGMKQETVIAPWGNLQLEFPTNYWPSDDGRVGDFKLDLSGFQLRFGIFIRF